MDTQPPTSPHDSDADPTIITPASSITPQQYPAGITARELAHALRGEVLGHFHLQEFVGGGGMGVVFKAHDRELDRVVAVKVLASQRLSTDDLQRRFKVEAQSAARLDHPNIARVYESGVERGLPYLVFEYIEGANVRDIVASRGPMPLDEALHCAYQAALALDHAQEREVIHRDIKPSNILLTPTGDAKLIDMGLARLKQEDKHDELTVSGMTLGTFDYLSPEQADDPRNADVRSDIYSLGCTLFFMLTGQAPFGQGTAVRKMMQHQLNPPPDVRRLRPDVPEPVSDLIRSMLAKSPGDRPQTPAQLAGMLAAILQEMGTSLTHPPTPIAWTPGLDARMLWNMWLPWVAAALILLGGIPLVGALTRDDGPPVDFAPLIIPAADAPPAESASPPIVAQGDVAPQSNDNEESNENLGSKTTLTFPSSSSTKPAGGPRTTVDQKDDDAVDIEWSPVDEPPFSDELTIDLSPPNPLSPSTEVSPSVPPEPPLDHDADGDSD